MSKKTKQQANLRPHSAIMLDGPDRAPSRAMLYPTGFKAGDFEKPVIGVASTWSNVTPCNMHIDLLAQEADVRAYDPAVRKLPPDLQDRVALTESAEEAARGADAILLVTEWDEFAALSDEQLKEIQKGMNLPVVIDARNLFEPSRLRVLGFEYYGLGVP